MPTRNFRLFALTLFLASYLALGCGVALFVANPPVPREIARPWPMVQVQEEFPDAIEGNFITSITHAWDDNPRIFATLLDGRIYVITRDGENWQASLFLDLRDQVNGDRELGLYNMVFHPNPNVPFVFVYYIDKAQQTVIARYAVSREDRNRADPTSAEILLTVPQPYRGAKGGGLAFDRDHGLYIGIGDGGALPGGPGDPNNYAQNPGELLGKILRIDVNPNLPLPYQIPATNPFVEQPGYRAEIWATGVRNPWRITFDRGTGDLYIADTGQSRWEEINYLPRDEEGGQNYGWRCYEGDFFYNLDGCGERTAYDRPIWTYSHVDDGCAVIGGYVYRGSQAPGLVGIYVYGDYCSGNIYGLRQLNGEWQSQLLTTLPDQDSPVTFGEDVYGNLYVGSLQGRIYRLFEGERADPS